MSPKNTPPSHSLNKKPNILMVISDQHNADLIGCAGHTQVHTPNLDRFAASGVRFTNAYTQNTICTPSRVSILSGQYCHNHGIYGLSGPAPSGLDNLMRHCRSHGYRTAAFGKLHLPNRPQNWLAGDLDRFGDTYETVEGVIGDSEFLRSLDSLGLREKEDSWHNPNNYGPGNISHDSRPSELPYEHTQEVWSAREAVQFIESGDQKPFCVQVAFQRPHHPLLPNERFWNMYPDDLELPPTINEEPDARPAAFKRMFKKFHQRRWDFPDMGEGWEAGARRAWRGTLACVSQVDDVFGSLLAFLEKNGLADKTIVVYCADHGGYHGIHGIEEKAPGICSDAVCRVPLIWRGPGVGSAMVTDQFVENVDITPTLLSMCDLPAMETADGLDASSLLSETSPPPLHELAVTENAWSKALRWDNWRFVHYPRDISPDGVDEGELYDIEADPRERRNLYFDPDYQNVVNECRRLLLEWLIRTTRTVTNHPAVRYKTSEPDNAPAEQWKGDVVVYDYPLAGDGKAPNPAQPRFRDHQNNNYI